EAAWLCDQLASGRGQRVAGQLEPVLAAMREISQTLAVHLPAGSAHAKLAAAPARLQPAELDTLLGRARDMAVAAAAAAPRRAGGGGAWGGVRGGRCPGPWGGGGGGRGRGGPGADRPPAR